MTTRPERARRRGLALVQALVPLSLVAIALLAWALARLPRQYGVGAGQERLVVFCAAGLMQPVEEVREEYERQFGVRVQLQYGGSGTLLNQLQTQGGADLFLPADVSYVDLAREAGLVDEVVPIAQQRAVIGVAPGNPHGVQTWRDLLRPELRVGIGEPEAAAIGQQTRRALEAVGGWDDLLARGPTTQATVNQLVNDLQIGALDAVVVWDSLASQHDTIETVRDPALAAEAVAVPACVVRGTEVPTRALHFARYLAAPERGRVAWDRAGFEAVVADAWAEVPSLELMSGAMLHAAIADTIEAFCRREGVEVDVQYNGCGILVASMRAGARPDAYFSCDVSFLEDVEDLFEPGRSLSSNRMVLLVPAGNPRGLEGVEDLLGEDLRVGVAHAEKSALGALFRDYMEARGLWDRFVASGNLAVETPTGDLLVAQMRSGSLDAVVVYASNASQLGDHVERLPLAGDDAVAVQPYAVGRDTRFPRLAQRLRDAIETAGSRSHFVSLDFTWLAGEDAGGPTE